MTAQQLKNSILQMAVQGKLVPQNPNDEPASILLERIRAEKERLIREKKIKQEKNPSIIFRGADNIPYEKVGDT
ncbi:restriction endonuclease subunit S, partial [bacterium 1XD42-8]